jgi:hypothetical protein
MCVQAFTFVPRKDMTVKSSSLEYAATAHALYEIKVLSCNCVQINVRVGVTNMIFRATSVHKFDCI